jgi:hypothetical protein
VERRDVELQHLHGKFEQLRSSSEGKVDKAIIKNLVLGYFGAGAEQKVEVQRLLARILDFNQQELERANISIGRHNTTSGLLQRLSALATSPSVTSGANSTSTDSISQQFVNFLQLESNGSGLTTSALSSSAVTRALATDFVRVVNPPSSPSVSQSQLNPLHSTSSSSNSSTSACLSPVTTTTTNNSLLSGFVLRHSRNSSTASIRSTTSDHETGCRTPTSGTFTNPLSLATVNSLAAQLTSAVISGNSPLLNPSINSLSDPNNKHDCNS